MNAIVLSNNNNNYHLLGVNYLTSTILFFEFVISFNPQIICEIGIIIIACFTHKENNV